MNEIKIMGNLGRDPELRYTGQGTPVLSFSLAHTDRPKNREPRTQWFRVLMWGKMAEWFGASGLRKGQRVIVFGRIDQNQWEDKDGAKRVEVQIHANQLYVVASHEPQESSGSFFPEE
jgi:single-strand DNA-binding protein